MAKTVKINLLSFFPGILAFLGYYEIISGVTVPFRFTINRVTHLFLVRLPLLGWLELDYVAYATALIGLIYINKGRPQLHHIILAASATSALLIGRILNISSIAYFGLGLAALASTALHAYRHGVKNLLPGVLVSISAMELAALVSLCSYYAIGGWNPIFLNILLRERLIWAPLEWFSILLIVVLMWIILTKIVLGRRFNLRVKLNILPLGDKSRKNEKSEKRKLILIFISILLIVLMILLPHLPTVNPEFKPISVDTVQYMHFFNEIGERGLPEALNKSAERPLFIVLIYYSWLTLSRDSVLLLDIIHPLVALSLLTLTSYYVVSRTRGRFEAAWASLLIPLGYLASAFIGGGFQANSLALSPALIALILIPDNMAGALKLALLLTLTTLLHPWTYTMYSAAILIKWIRDKRKIMFSLAAIILSYLIAQIIDYSIGAIIVAEVTAEPIIKEWSIQILFNWFDAGNFWVWNTLSNPLYIFISALSTGNPADPVFAAAAPLTIILPGNLLFRVFLNLPLQLNSSEFIEKLETRFRGVFLLSLFVRALGNLSGLTALS